MLMEAVNGVLRCHQPKPTQRQLILSLQLLRNMVASRSAMSCLVMCGFAVDKATWEFLYKAYVNYIEHGSIMNIMLKMTGF